MDFHPTEAAGYRDHTVARSTGTLVLLLDGGPAGLDTEAGRWQTLCDEHSWIISHETIAVARGWFRHPEEWCEDCMEAVR